MKILWALDIFESHPKAISASVGFIQALSKRTELKVDAISVVRSLDFGISTEEGMIIKNKNIKILDSILGPAKKEKWFGGAIVLIESQIPQRVAVADLTEYAKENDYDAILLIKHSYKKNYSSFLGSFSRKTVFQSSIPIFLINPDGFIPKDIGKIIVAIDEGSKKEREFKEFVGFIPVKGINVKIFHKIKIPFHYFLKSSIKQYVSDRKRIILNSFRAIIRIGENVGSTLEVDIRSVPKKVDEAILQEAKKGDFDLIATIHRRNEIEGYLFGRTAKRIFQNADRPVLLFRP